MKRRIVLVTLLALAVGLSLAVTATAKPKEPHFVMHAEGTLDHVFRGEADVRYDGIPYWDGSTYVIIDGSIDVTIDVESVSNAIGPYDDGSDWSVKWDYVVRGVVTAVVSATAPDGTDLSATYTMDVKRITRSLGYPQHVFLDVQYRGAKYTMYVSQNYLGEFVFLPFVGDILGSADGSYGVVYAADDDDFSFYFNDPDVEL